MLQLPEGRLFQEFSKQREASALALSGDYRYVLYGGGIRGGKTYWLVALTLTLARIFPGSRWALVRKDLPTLRRNLLPTFEKLRPRGFCGPVNQSDWTAKCTNGSVILFFTESIQEDPDLDRWKGLEVNGFGLDEANELQKRSFVKAQERAGSWIVPGSAPQPPAVVLMTCNPSPLWPKQMFYDPWQAGSLAAPYAFVPALAADNPYLPADYVAKLKDLPELDYKRFVQGDWTVLTGQFFDGLGDAHWVPAIPAKDLQPWWTYWGGFDWGYRHNAVFTALCKDGDGNVFVLDTLYQQRTPDHAQASTIAELMPEACRRMVYAGPDCFAQGAAHAARPQTVADVFAEYGIFLTPATDKRVAGWAALRRGLDAGRRKDTKTPLVRFCDTPGNRRLFDDLAALTANATNGKDVQKVDADEYGSGGDDGPDALRYAVVSALPEWAQVVEPRSEAVSEDHYAPGYDYRLGTRKPSRQRAALQQWQRDTARQGIASPLSGIRMPGTGRTPGVA